MCVDMGRRCCCNGCERKLPKELRCCCNCICDAICVTISIPYDDDCDCDEISTKFDYDCATDSYHGTIVCGGLSVDLEFIVKTCDGNCYICLVSDCLDMPYGTCPDDCQEFTPGRAFCRGDYDGRVRTGGFSAEWEDVDFSGCGDSYCGTGTISIECVDRVFPACSGDCGEPLCTGCDCFCRCICITYFDDECFETVEACWDDYIGGWTASIACPSETITITITLGSNEYTGACELSVSTSVGDGDAAEGISCPDIEASWTITKEDETEAIVSIVCKNCADCDAEGVECLCDGRKLPRFLVATISDDNGNCSCWDGQVLLLEYEVEVCAPNLHCWTACSDPFNCNGTTNDFRIVLQCPDGPCEDFRLFVLQQGADCPNLGPCIDISNVSPDEGCSCDPLSLVFSDLDMVGADCCGDISDLLNRRLTVTISE